MSKNETNTPSSTNEPSTDEFGSNPFTSDLKSEFTSSFGTEANTVSQLLSEKSYDYKRPVMLGVIFLGLLCAFYYFTSSGDKSVESLGESDEIVMNQNDELQDPEQPFGETEEEDDVDQGLADLDSDVIDDSNLSEQVEDALEEQGPDDQIVTQDMVQVDQGNDPSTSDNTANLGSEGVAINLSPVSGARRSYDETSEYAVFSWEASGSVRIVFSRNPSMVPVEVSKVVSGNSYRLRHPWPGRWYWRVENAAGMSEVRDFVVEAPVRRNVKIEAPVDGATISGDGGSVHWTGDTRVARYKVELSSSSWTNPEYQFQTSGTGLNLNGVSSGQYKLRVASFSEVSGRWEYTQEITVEVQ